MVSDDTKDITKKCEQYWNEPGPFTDAEVHTILECIHISATKAATEIERLTKTANMQSEWIHENCGLAELNGKWVTPSQLTAAVEFINNIYNIKRGLPLGYKDDVQAWLWEALNILGFERCKCEGAAHLGECNGIGAVASETIK